MKLFVTGGTGFLGRNVVSRLAARGHEIVMLSRRPVEDLPVGVRVVLGDVRGYSPIRDQRR